jgi:hypothetical protein
VKNKARVEGSICNTYLVEKSSTFFSYYFSPDVQTRHTNVACNEEFSFEFPNKEQLLFVCCARGRALGNTQTRFLSSEELRVATKYILLNYEEIQPYVIEFSNGLVTQHLGISEMEIGKRIEKEFAGWFKKYMSCLSFSSSLYVLR